jgi:hypothetical protein
MPDTSTGSPRRLRSIGHRRGAECARGFQFVLWSYTPTTFLSALLLFSVQPMFAKTAAGARRIAVGLGRRHLLLQAALSSATAAASAVARRLTLTGPFISVFACWRC